MDYSSLLNSNEQLFLVQFPFRLSRMYFAQPVAATSNVLWCSRGYFHIRRSGGLAPKFVSEILVGAPNSASKNIGDKYSKFCPLNFRFDPKIGIFPQLLRLVITELPKFFLLLDELGRTLPQIP